MIASILIYTFFVVWLLWIVLFSYAFYRMWQEQRKTSAENKQLRKDLYDLCCSHNKLCIDITHLHGSAYRNRQ